MPVVRGRNLNWGTLNAIVHGVEPTVPLPDTAQHREIGWWDESGVGSGPWALRVHDPSGSSSFAAILAAIVAKGADTADSVRGVRSGIDLLLAEMQHPKQVLYLGTVDVALPPATATFITPWIDTVRWRWVGYYIRNTGGQNPITAESTIWSEEQAAIGAGFSAGNAAAVAIAPAACYYVQRGTVLAGSWDPSTTAPLAARYVRLEATSTLGTTARACVVGMR